MSLTCTGFIGFSVSSRFPICFDQRKALGRAFLFLAPSLKVTLHCCVLKRQTVLLWSWHFPRWLSPSRFWSLFCATFYRWFNGEATTSPFYYLWFPISHPFLISLFVNKCSYSEHAIYFLMRPWLIQPTSQVSSLDWGEYHPLQENKRTRAFVKPVGRLQRPFSLEWFSIFLRTLQDLMMLCLLRLQITWSYNFLPNTR